MPTSTKVLKSESPEAIQVAVDTILAGGIVAIPTDTVYGLAAHGLQPNAIRRIFEVKQRSLSNAIPLLLADPDDLAEITQDIMPATQQLAEAFWPGPLSIIVFKRDSLPDVVTAGGNTVAVRMPDHPIALTLIDMVGAPVTGTSANRSGNPTPPISSEYVMRDLGGSIDLLLDGGACPGGKASTVIDMTTQPPTLRRQGPITPVQIEEVIEQKIRT